MNIDKQNRKNNVISLTVVDSGTVSPFLQLVLWYNFAQMGANFASGQVGVWELNKIFNTHLHVLKAHLVFRFFVIKIKRTIDNLCLKSFVS